MTPAVPLQASKQEAAEWEHRFLSQFDYAWNRRCNAEARHVALRQVTATEHASHAVLQWKLRI